MSYKGKVENGQIKLLPEGAAVSVELLVEPPMADFAVELLKLAKDRDWPADMSLNHDHYIHGTPKR